MQKKNSKLVDPGQMARVVSASDALLEKYLRDWGSVTAWRLAGNAGYPSGEAVTSRAAQKVASIPEVGCRYLGIESCLVNGGVIRSMATQMYVGVGMTLERFVIDRCGPKEQRARVRSLLPVYQSHWRSWRRRSARELGLMELVASDLGAWVAEVETKPVTASRPVVGLPGYGEATARDYEALRRIGVLV